MKQVDLMVIFFKEQKQWNNISLTNITFCGCTRFDI